MFKKKHRLGKETEVKMTFAKGRSFFSPYFILKFLKKPETSLPRFTVVVSTKVSKKAVTRNRLKRIAREVVRSKLKEFKPGDYILTIKAPALSLESKEFSSQLTTFFIKVKVI